MSTLDKSELARDIAHRHVECYAFAGMEIPKHSDKCESLTATIIAVVSSPPPPAAQPMQGEVNALAARLLEAATEAWRNSRIDPLEQDDRWIAASALTAMQQKVGELEKEFAEDSVEIASSCACRWDRDAATIEPREECQYHRTIRLRAEAAESALQAEKVKYVKAGIEAAGNLAYERAEDADNSPGRTADLIYALDPASIANAVQEKTDDKG